MEKFLTNLNNKEQEKTIDALTLSQESYFNDLGLDLDFLRDKKILDVGAGQAHFAKAMKKYGVEVTSTDVVMGGWGHEGELEIPEDLDYVVSDGTKMPFADSSFDLIVSRSSMPFVLGSKQEVISFMKEINRILKDGGEFRFGPGMGGFNNKIYNKGELFTEEEEKSLSRDERVERKNMKAEEFIRGIEAEDGRDMGDGLSVLNISKGDREDLSFVYKK